MVYYLSGLLSVYLTSILSHVKLRFFNLFSYQYDDDDDDDDDV